MNAARARRREAARPSPAVEDYLKAVYLLRTEDPAAAVTVQRLAGRLKVSGPSVTNMAKRLAELGLVRHERYRGVGLTPAGERIALEVVRHHRLLERYLVEALGYDWDEVHEEADRLEHHVSEAMEARMAAALGDPTVDPHGDPIPGVDGSLPDVVERRLPELAPGEEAIVGRVTDQDPERLRYLQRLGLRPGVVLTLVDALPFEGPMRIRIDDAEHVIGLSLAAAIQVTVAHRDGNRNDSATEAS